MNRRSRARAMMEGGCRATNRRQESASGEAGVRLVPEQQTEKPRLQEEVGTLSAVYMTQVWRCCANCHQHLFINNRRNTYK